MKRRDLVQKIEEMGWFSFDMEGNTIGIRTRSHGWRSQSPGTARLRNFSRSPS